MAGNSIIQKLILNLEANTAQLQTELKSIGTHFKGLTDVVGKVKTLIAGSFAVDVIKNAAVAVYGFAQEIDGIIGKLDDVGQSVDLAFNAGKLKAIADVFGVDIDGVLNAANAASVQFGISMKDALSFVQKGLALAGPESDKYLKSLKDQSAGFAQLGGNADQFFSLVTDGFRTQSDFESKLKYGTNQNIEAFSKLTDKFNDGQIIQQKLVDTTAALNAEFAGLFDGTGDKVDSLHIALNEIAVTSLTAIKNGVIAISNAFGSLYNNSYLFRGVLQLIILNFNLMIDSVKVFANAFYNVFKTVGKVVKELLNGNFSAIGGIIKDSLKEAGNDVIARGKEIKDDFVNAFNNTVTAPIQIINPDDVKKDAIAAKKIIQNVLSGPAKAEAPTQQSNIHQVSVKGLDTSALPDATKYLKSFNVEAGYSYSAFERIGLAIKENLTDTAVPALQNLATVLGETMEQSSASFSDSAKLFVNSTKQILAASLAQALAKTIAANAAIPFPLSIIEIAAGSAAIYAAMSAIKVPAFEKGGVGSGMILAGEKGPELINLGSTSSRIFNNGDTNRILSGGNGMKISGEFYLRGNDLVASVNETNARRFRN